MLLKASSHIVFDGIQWYCNTLVQPHGNTWVRFWILANTLNTVKYRVLQIELVSIHNTVKYPWQPLVTVGNHMVTHQIPLDNFGNPECSNYLLSPTDTKQQQKMETTFVRDHPFCLFEQIPPKYKYTSNYCWQPKYHQIPRYLMVFGLPTSNTEYCQILPNTTCIWELALSMF